MAKTVLITGGARGIGRVTAMRLLADGYNVAFTYATSREAAEEFVKTDRERLRAYAGDVRDDGRNREIVDDVASRFGAIDALVNNAGIRRDALMFHMTDEQWGDVIDTNLRGAFSMIHAAIPAMMKQRRGAIVNVASVSGLRGVVGQANYSAAKGGLIAMTRSLAREVARSGIRVNCVAPGLVETDMVSALDPDAKRNMIHEIPMRRAITADEVAAGIAFLISDEASGITGQVLCIDGGVSA
ncbi:MAG TPA: 3-oxoacyl-ACP reductase FabG [Thermoanaerobaculia bacterium]|nr:3-oxoacyl-ACP reductase FabG [Thermoanaerobaculia bacterium]